MKRQYELKVQGKRKPVVWDGETGNQACQDYADTHPGAVVTAWRDYPQHGVFLVDPRQVKG